MRPLGWRSDEAALGAHCRVLATGAVQAAQSASCSETCPSQALTVCGPALPRQEHEDTPVSASA